MNAYRSLFWTAAAAAALLESCVGDVATPEPQPDGWIDVPVPPVVAMNVSALAADGRGTLYMGTDGQVTLWRSLDGGSAWIERTLGLNTRFWVNALLVKDAGATIFAALSGGGVFLSRNRGDSWQQVNNHLTDIEATSLAAAPDGAVLVGTSSGKIFRTENDGDVWVEAATGPPFYAALSFAVDRSGVVYAAAGWGGVRFSADSGRTWEASSPGIEDGWVRCLAAREEGDILAGTNNGIYRTPGANEAWIRIDGGTLSGLTVYALAEDRSGGLLAGTDRKGVLRSSDGGYSWEPWNVGLQSVGIRSLLLAGDDLLAGTSNRGVFISKGAGDAWNPPRSYITDEPIYSNYYWERYSLSIDSCGTYYLNRHNAIYRSRDAGETWILTCAGVPLYILEVAVHPGSYLLASTAAGVYISDDSGDSWAPADSFQGYKPDVSILAVAPDGTVFGRTDEGVVRFADRCSSFERVLENQQIIDLSAGSSGCVYAGTYYGGVLGSNDGGDTWRRLTDSLRIYSLAADRVGNVFATSEEGILCSGDGGATWITLPIDSALNRDPASTGVFYYTIALAPDGAMAFIFDDEGTLYASDDRFASWKTIEVPYTGATLTQGPDGHLYLNERYSPALHRSRDSFAPAR